MCFISEAMSSEISNSITFHGNPIGCAIGAKQVSITNHNNGTTGVQQPTVQSNRVGNALETGDGSQAVDDGRRRGGNDGNGSNIPTESGEDGSGLLSPHDAGEREEDRMFVDQENRNSYNGQTSQAAHILDHASNVHISGSKLNSIAGSSSKTTSKLVY
jgi:hypothetical protein